MKKAKLISAKRSFFMSVLSLILCFAMLIGTTYAWFTDSVTSGVNQIKAGNLDVELLHQSKNDTNATSVSGETTLFDDVALWEPGAYAYETFTIKNVGNLAFKYSMVINAVNANEVNGHSLDEVLKVKVVDTAPASRPAYTDGADLKTWSYTSGSTPLYPVSNANNEPSEKTFTVVVYWEPTDNDNQWNMNNGNKGKTLSVDLGISLVATQLPYEADSFDDQYDKDAVYGDEYGDVMVSSVDELKTAIEDPAKKIIAVNGDLTYDWGNGSYDNSKALNMKGKTFLGANDAASITFAGYGSANPIVDATFKDITIKDNTVGDSESNWEHCYLEFKNLTAVNVTFANGIMMQGDFATFKNCSFDSHKDDEYAVWVANGDATFEGCTFTGSRGVKVHEAYGTEVGTVVIDNNTFAGLTKKPGVAIGTVNAATTIKITNNVFDATNKYETNTDVATFTFVDENNTMMLRTAEQLAAVLQSNDKNITAVLAADIELPISSLGEITPGSGEYKLGGENTETITINLNDHKLNVTTNYWSILGAKNSNATITIKNGVMTSSQETGTWNSYDLGFTNCKFVFENVTFDKAIALESDATLKNVTINETHDYYAMWITAEGQTVTIDGLTIDSAGRGIKIDEQYIAAPAKVTLNVSNATFKTVKKAAIMVKSAAGADITLDNVNIANTIDTVNAVWNDANAAAYISNVTVNGGSMIQET